MLTPEKLYTVYNQGKLASIGKSYIFFPYGDLAASEQAGFNALAKFVNEATQVELDTMQLNLLDVLEENPKAIEEETYG